MKLRTNKSIAKRFRITKNGKILKRHEGQDHFNARSTGKQTRRKRRDHALSETNRRAVRHGMPYENA